MDVWHGVMTTLTFTDLAHLKWTCRRFFDLISGLSDNEYSVEHVLNGVYPIDLMRNRIGNAYHTAFRVHKPEHLQAALSFDIPIHGLEWMEEAECDDYVSLIRRNRGYLGFTDQFFDTIHLGLVDGIQELNFTMCSLNMSLKDLLANTNSTNYGFRMVTFTNNDPDISKLHLYKRKTTFTFDEVETDSTIGMEYLAHASEVHLDTVHPVDDTWLESMKCVKTLHLMHCYVSATKPKTVETLELKLVVSMHSIWDIFGDVQHLIVYESIQWKFFSHLKTLTHHDQFDYTIQKRRFGASPFLKHLDLVLPYLSFRDIHEMSCTCSDLRFELYTKKIAWSKLEFDEPSREFTCMDTRMPRICCNRGLYRIHIPSCVPPQQLKLVYAHQDRISIDTMHIVDSTPVPSHHIRVQKVLFDSLRSLGAHLSKVLGNSLHIHNCLLKQEHIRLLILTNAEEIRLTQCRFYTDSRKTLELYHYQNGTTIIDNRHQLAPKRWMFLITLRAQQHLVVRSSKQ
jgi:hypothetical protein